MRTIVKLMWEGTVGIPLRIKTSLHTSGVSNMKPNYCLSQIQVQLPNTVLSFLFTVTLITLITVSFKKKKIFYFVLGKMELSKLL